MDRLVRDGALSLRKKQWKVNYLHLLVYPRMEKVEKDTMSKGNHRTYSWDRGTGINNAFHP